MIFVGVLTYTWSRLSKSDPTSYGKLMIELNQLESSNHSLTGQSLAQKHTWWPI